MHQAGHIHATMRLHAKVPLVTLLGLMHLGIPRACGVLRRAGRFDDRGIDDRALAHRDPLVGGLEQSVPCSMITNRVLSLLCNDTHGF